MLRKCGCRCTAASTIVTWKAVPQGAGDVAADPWPERGQHGEGGEIAGRREARLQRHRPAGAAAGARPRAGGGHSKHAPTRRAIPAHDVLWCGRSQGFVAIAVSCPSVSAMTQWVSADVHVADVMLFSVEVPLSDDQVQFCLCAHAECRSGATPIDTERCDPCVPRARRGRARRWRPSGWRAPAAWTTRS